MSYKRNEPFRYTFPKPVYCLVEVDNKKIDAEILDISPNGLKLLSLNDLPLSTNINITFGLNGNQIKVGGTVRWKKCYSQTHIAGLQLNNKPYLSRLIIKELKRYVKGVQKSNFG